MLKNEHVLVLGLAKSGYAAASILHEHGVNVIVNDQKPFEENEPAQLLSEKGLMSFAAAILFVCSMIKKLRF